MNETLDIVGSSIIGGFILIMLIGLTLNYSSENQETKLSEISQYSMASVGSILSNDFDKLGYRVSGNKILSITSNSISFLGDINNDGTTDTISYSTVQQNNTLNLKRYVGNSKSSFWIFPIQSLKINGIDSSGNSTFTINNIRGISVSIVLSQQTMSNSQTKVGAFWERAFYPKNL